MRPVVAFLAGLVPALSVVSMVTAQGQFQFEALRFPIPAGDGVIINGYGGGSRHTGGDRYGLDLCAGAGCQQGTIGVDVVVAPTDLVYDFSVDANGVPDDPDDFHFFEVAANAERRLCLSLGHFELTESVSEVNGRRTYTRGQRLGTLMDYAYSIPHVHIGLYSVPVASRCGSKEDRRPLPFVGDYSLDGVAYPIDGQQLGPVISTNGRADAIRIDPADWLRETSYWDEWGPTLEDNPEVEALGSPAVHAYGRAVGQMSYAFELPAVPAEGVIVSARMSSEEAGYDAPDEDVSDVTLAVNGVPVGTETVIADDGAGQVVSWVVPRERLESGRNVLTFRVGDTGQAEGLAIYGCRFDGSGCDAVVVSPAG